MTSHLWEYRTYCLKFPRAIRTARGLWTERTGVWIRQRSTPDSPWTYGEAAPLSAWGSESVADIMRFLQNQDTHKKLSLTDIPPTLPALQFAVLTLTHIPIPNQDTHQIPVAQLLPLGHPPTPDLFSVPFEDTHHFISGHPWFSMAPLNQDTHKNSAQEGGKGDLTIKAKIDASDDCWSTWKQWVSQIKSWRKIMIDKGFRAVRIHWDANGSLNPALTENWLHLSQDVPDFEFLEEPCGWDNLAPDLPQDWSGRYPHRIAWDESVQPAMEKAQPGSAFTAIMKPSCMGVSKLWVSKLTSEKDGCLQLEIPAGWRVVLSSAWESPIGREAVAQLSLHQKKDKLALGLDSPFSQSSLHYKTGLLTDDWLEKLWQQAPSSIG